MIFCCCFSSFVHDIDLFLAATSCLSLCINVTWCNTTERILISLSVCCFFLYHTISLSRECLVLPLTSCVSCSCSCSSFAFVLTAAAASFQKETLYKLYIALCFALLFYSAYTYTPRTKNRDGNLTVFQLMVFNFLQLCCHTDLLPI